MMTRDHQSDARLRFGRKRKADQRLIEAERQREEKIK